MSSEPVNNQEVGLLTRRIEYSPSWVPSYVTVYEADTVHNSICLKHPATIHNKRGPDGTWPRSAWDKSWFRCFVPGTRWSTQVKPGRSAWFQPKAFTGIIGTLSTSTTQQWTENAARFRPDPLDVLNAENTARTKVLNKLATKKWDLGVTVLEFRQTAELVSSLATSVTKGIIDICSLRQKTRKQTNALFRRVRQHDDFYRAAHEVGMRDTRFLEECRDRWMELQFGIKPLVYDIEDAGQTLSDAIFGDKWVPGLTVDVKSGHTIKGSRNFLMPVAPNVPFSTRLRCATEVNCHISASYRVPTEGLAMYNQLGLDNAASIAWEATRLSWMVDYAFGVGDWLSSFSAAAGLEFISASMSTTLRCTADSVQHHMEDGDLVFTRKPATIGVILDSGKFTRVLLPHGVFPAFAPPIKSELSLVQLANSLSAISGLLGGKSATR